MSENQTEIRVSRVSAVTPAMPNARHRMFLSSLDLSWVPFNNCQNLLFYKILSPETKFSTIVEMLKRSLSIVLVDFYPFAGRLDIKGGESGRLEIDCNNGNVEFIEASIDMAFLELERDDFQHKNFFEELVRTHENSYDAPLLSVQVTDFLGTGICIGVSFHHVVSDANSFWHFMKCWAECSRGLPISNNPEHMRIIFKKDRRKSTMPNVSFKGEEAISGKGAQVFKFVREHLPPTKSKSPMAHKEINLNTSDATAENIEKSPQKPMTVETKLETSKFHFSEEMIRNLKERARASSSFVAVAAHFWRCVTKAREIPEKEPVYFLLFADCRGLVNPPLRPTYFGNCLSKGCARTTAKKLLMQDICFAAGLIQELVNSCATEIQLNNMIDWAESHLSIHGVVPRLLDGRYIVNVVSSPKLPVYDINYGWGKPVSVQVPSIDNIGGMVLFCGRDGGKSIDLSTRLPYQQMETLRRTLLIPNFHCRY